MTPPSFVNLDGATLLAENIAAYEAITGRTLQPAQAEMLLINAFTEIQLRTLYQIQSACTQMLVSFATAPALDELAKLVGVERLPASGAGVTIQFEIIDGHGGVIIPSGTRVQSNDGKVIFAVVANTEVATGETTADVECICQNIGTIGNGYAIGNIEEIIDPLSFVIAASNINVSSGGANAETDDELRSRIILAPSQYSVAGPRDAYAFFAKSASPVIIDVAVSQLSPGTVGVYPLVAGGVTPPEVLTLVETALNDDSIRPLTDTVVVDAPTVVDYDIEIDVTTYEGADVGVIEDAITEALTAYAETKATSMGQDVILSQIVTKAGAITGVYKIEVTSPASDLVIAFNEVPIIGTITVNMVGENEG
jgi:phage-related baseplate assembly protein